MKQILINIYNHTEFKKDIEKAKRELARGKYKSKLLHVYSGIEDASEIRSYLRMLIDELPGIPMVGTLSAGEIIEDEIPPKGMVATLMLFKQSEARVLRYIDVKDNEKNTGEMIVKEVSGIENVQSVELLMPGTEFNTAAFLNELEALPNEVSVFGGYSGGHSLDKSEHFIFNYDGIDFDAVYAIVYSGKNLHVDVEKSAGWEKLGRPFKITKADGNRLMEINGKPAIEVYEKYLHIGAGDNFAEETFEFPLDASMDNEELLRHTITVEDDGTLLLAGYVQEGMDIYLSYGNPDSIVDMVNHRLIAMADFEPEVVLLYSCSVRKSFWESFAEIEVKPFQEIAETAGFYTWGEVKRNPENGKLYEYNITMLSVGMREGDKKGKITNYPIVDDSVLKGQASLLKRLTKLVSSTTSELQKAFDQMSELNRRLRRMADYDDLTSIFNRRKIEEVINARLNNASHKNSTAVLMMMDIDHFKDVNDTFGHRVGDEVLVEFAGILDEAVKLRNGNVGRWGGEEFVAIIPDIDEKAGYNFAESLRKKVEEHVFPDVERITVSIGMICSDGKGNRQENYTKVDNALYSAKEAGRNRTVVA